MPFGFGKSKDKKDRKGSKDVKKVTSPSHTYGAPRDRGTSNTPSPSNSTSEIPKAVKDHSLVHMESSMLVKQHTEYYETLTRKTKPSDSRPGSGQYSDSASPEKKRAANASTSSSTPTHGGANRISVHVSVTSPTAAGSGSGTNLTRTTSGQSSGHSSMSPTPSQGNYTPTNKRSSFLSSLTDLTSDHGREKSFDGVKLPLPPLQTTNVRLRDVEATKSAPGGGFGFILRKSFLPVPEDPEKTRLVHLVEPRIDYLGPLMTGDRIIEVNGENVEEEAHESVVEMIKASGDCVYLRVASMPELLELNARGALDVTLQRSNQLRKSGRGKAKHGTGTLRRQNKTKFKAKTEEEVLSEKEGLEQDKVWVVHSEGFSLGTVHHSPLHKPQGGGHYTNMLRLQSRDKVQVKLTYTDEVVDVEDDDIEKANPSSLDKVEDLVDLVHLNESSVLHVLRQRYGSSLIHTFAGSHLIVLNPLKPLSSYVDRVIDMFRGCRRADMPPHIFAMGQQAYRDMMVTRQDQSLILQGLSGSGKTFNARYLLRYLTTVGQPDQGPVSNARLDAVELLLHSFGSAATFLNPQATRCTCLYTLDFDPSGTVVSASVKTYLLEKFRVAQRPAGEGNFNILYQMIAGADSQLRADLLLDAAVAEAEEPNLYYEPLDDPQRNESAAYVWDLIQNCLDILDISEEEALGLWSLLAAIYHLGFAGVKKGQVRGSDCFQNPAAAQRAASVLGINHEVLGRFIFSPPRGHTSFHSNLNASSPTPSDSTSITSSLFLANLGGNRSLFLDAFVMGLYDQAVNALVLLINRALQGVKVSKRTSSIHVVDMPGFQHRELAGARDGASLDDLCMNYAQERLQMLFHDWTFTSEQDRYIQEEINWMFSEIAVSPLPVIDTIDRHVPQRRGGAIDVHTDRRGLLWILDEESVFPGATDGSFLDRVQMYHGDPSTMGDTPLVKVIKEDNQFSILHCQRTLGVLYDANGWVKRAREHPSFRVVVQVMAESKRVCLASIFQGKGVAASVTTLGNSQLKADTHRTLSRTTSSQVGGVHYSSPSGGIKKTSVCLQTKFQLDYLIDTLRKTHQWFIRCILPQLPHKLPGALERESTPNQDRDLPHGEINIPLVRAQIRRAELVKAARIYKQGYPEHMSFPEFRRRYLGLLSPDSTDSSSNGKETVQNILFSQGVDGNSFKVGLSQAFFRAGTLARLDRQVEDSSHDIMVLFQARCRGWLGRQKFHTLQVQDAGAMVIQQNMWAYHELKEWSWWKLFLKIKPMLAIWRAEEDIKDRESKIEKLKAKVETLENERDALKESESLMEEKVNQLSAQLDDIHSSANEASELIESEQLEKRELEEHLAESSAHEKELTQENEQLKLQIAEMSILARIKNDHASESSETVMERYLETKRELEMLRQRVTSEYEDQIESLEATKRTLEKRLADSESEQSDLTKTLSQVRKKAAKYGSEMNDLKLLLEQQQARNAELEKRQRKFDADLSASKEDATSEIQAKEQLAREKDLLQTEFDELRAKFKELEEDHKHVLQEKEDLESEVLSSATSQSTESELTSLKRMKRDMDTKIEELEDELDEANVKLDTLQQTKARLELSNQTLKQAHSQELEGREQELEQVKNTMSKKLKALNQQLEELHEEKHAAVKARRDLERDLLEYQSKMGDPEVEKKLRKQLKKVKTLYQDTVEQLEHEREMRSNSAMVKSLRNQLEDLQASEATASKAQKRLQGEVNELQIQCDELARAKIELEGKVSELSREKDELESRVEEDQDEIEELLDKQRSHISQTTSLQSQLTEANLQVEELEDTKQNLEAKVQELTSKMSELESGVNKYQFEASEMKVKELEQKLELERSSARRHDSQIQRLRHQLERVQEEKSDSVSHQNTDALKRLQKQNRDLRHELQEAERKEQDANKKKRAAEAQIEELEARLQNTKADLQNAQKRIETLHGALKGHEAYSDEEDIRDDTLGEYDDDDDLSSNASSYKVGEIDDLDLSDTEGSGLLDQSPPTRTRTWERRSQERSRDLTPRIEEEEEEEGTYSRRQKKVSIDSEDIKLTKYDKKSTEDDYVPRRGSRDYLKDTEDDYVPRRGSRDYLKDTEDDYVPRRGSRDYLKDTEDDYVPRRGSKDYLKLSDEEDIQPKRKISASKLEDTPRKSSTLDRLTDHSSRSKPTENKASSLHRDSKQADLDDDDDDDDLEEFLLKQRERMKRLQDEGDSFEPISIRSRHSKSPSHEESPRLNGKDKSMSRDGSEVSLVTEEEKASEKARQLRRKKQRRRTIEQLSSPEHQAAKASGAL